MLSLQNAELASRARRAKLTTNNSAEVELYKSAMKEVASRDREIAQLEELLGSVYDWLPHFSKYSDTVLKRMIKVASLKHTCRVEVFSGDRNEAPLPQAYLLDDLRRLQCLGECGFSITFDGPHPESEDEDDLPEKSSIAQEASKTAAASSKPGLMGDMAPDSGHSSPMTDLAVPSPAKSTTAIAVRKVAIAEQNAESSSATDKEMIKELMLQCQQLQYKADEWKQKYDALHDSTETKLRRLRAENVALELQLRNLQEMLDMTETSNYRLLSVQNEVAFPPTSEPLSSVVPVSSSSHVSTFANTFRPEESTTPFASTSKTGDFAESTSTSGMSGQWHSTACIQTIRQFLDISPTAGLSLTQPVSKQNNCLSVQGIQIEVTRLMNLVTSNRTSTDGSLWSSASKQVSVIHNSFYSSPQPMSECERYETIDRFDERDDNPQVKLECGLLRNHWKVNVNGMIKPSGLMTIQDTSISTLFFQEYCMQFDSSAEASMRLRKLMSSISLWRNVDNRTAGGNISLFKGMKALTQSERNMLDVFALLLDIAGRGTKNSVEYNSDLEKFVGTKRTSNVTIRRTMRGVGSSASKMPVSAASYMRRYMTSAFWLLIFDDIFSRCFCAMQKYAYAVCLEKTRASPLDLSAGALPSTAPVGDIGKILQRVFDCTIKSKLLVQSHADGALALVDEMVGEMSGESCEVEETANRYEVEGSCVTVSDGSLAYIVQYNKNIYKTSWWTYLPASLFHKLAKSIEALAFKNSSTEFQVYDAMLLTWGTIEMYHYELRSSIIAAYNFINRMCTSVDLTKAYDCVASTNSFSFLCSCLLRGKHAITAPGQGSRLHPFDKDGYSALLAEVLADEIIPMPRSTLLMLINLENSGQLTADKFADVVLAMGHESFSKLHALIDCGGASFEDTTGGIGEVSDMCSASFKTMRLKLRKHMLREGQMLLNQLRTLILATSVLRSTKVSNKEVSIDCGGLVSGSAFKKGAIVNTGPTGIVVASTARAGAGSITATLAAPASVSSANTIDSTVHGHARSSFKLKVQTSNTVTVERTPTATTTTSSVAIPSWARNGSIDEDDEDDEDDDSDEDSGYDDDEELANVAGNAFVEPVLERDQTDGLLEEENGNYEFDSVVDNIHAGSHVVGSMEILLHQAELCFDPSLRAAQGIPATLLDVYFSYHGLRRMLHYLYMSGTQGDECLNMLSHNVTAVNHFRYVLLKKVFTKWSLLDFHHIRK